MRLSTQILLLHSHDVTGLGRVQNKQLCFHLHVEELMAWQEFYLNSYSTYCAINALHVQDKEEMVNDLHKVLPDL